MSCQFVEIDDILKIHRAVLEKSKTKASLRDFSLLHSAVERPKATFGGRELYPTVFLKAAALLQSLCMNHSFTDGNKRVAWLSAKRFLFLNGYYMRAEAFEAVDFMLKVDGDKLDVKSISLWLKEHSSPVK